MTWWRQPPRCLDCEHPVGMKGDHWTDYRRVYCRRCGDAVHYLSMAYDYPGAPVPPDGRPRLPKNWRP